MEGAAESAEVNDGAPTPPPPPQDAAAEPTGEQPTRLMAPLERQQITGERSTGGEGDPADILLGTGLMERHPPSDGDAVAVPKVCPHCGTEYETEARFCPRDGASLRPRGGSDPVVGTTLADRYHMLKTVGEGGMGRVYLAEHVRMNRQCAVKVMRSALVHDADAAARFGREASSAARILHPNVAAVFDFGESDGLVYLVMEYVDGEPLGAILAREQRLPPERAVDIARQVADGLAAAHELGIVHRDLKPDNIIVSRARNGREIPKVVDFGIAKAVAEGPSETLTRSGFVIGTPEFMSPEQLLGDPVDARSDIYSLGCILYLMLLGVPAADAPTREAMLKRRLREAPTPPSQLDPTLPESLDPVVLRMLATTPDERFSSAVELRDALDAVAGVPRPPTTEGFPFLPGSWQGPPSGESPLPMGAAAMSGGLDGAVPPVVLEPLATIRPGQPASRRWPLVAVGAGVLSIVAILALVNRDDGAIPAATAPADAVGATTAAVPGVSSPIVPGAADSARLGTPPAPGQPEPAGTTTPAAGGNRPAATPTPPVRTETSAARPVDVARRRVVAAAERYASAIASRDMSRVQQAYPGLPSSQRDRLQTMFNDAQRISARVSAGSVNIDGSRATLAFTLRLVIVPSSTQDEVQSNLNYVATLAQEGDRWVIRELTQR